jgi:hypothetical protein
MSSGYDVMSWVAAPPASTAPGRQRLMRDAFGPHADAVFTPPWNRCEPAVADALVTLGFEVLSRDASAPRLDRPDLVDLPVTVDWFGIRKGIRWTRGEMGEVIAASIRCDRAVGVMLHHAVTDEAELAAVDELLALVEGHAHARATTIMSLEA